MIENESMNTIKLNSLKGLQQAAEQFIAAIGQQKVFAFYGEMGAGKTTFIKAVCRHLGVTENITSPTFSLVNEYFTEKGNTIYHFDCYRLKNIQEACDIGVEEYFYSNNLCFIEWPEKIEDLLPLNRVDVNINVLDNGKREISLVYN